MEVKHDDGLTADFVVNRSVFYYLQSRWFLVFRASRSLSTEQSSTYHYVHTASCKANT